MTGLKITDLPVLTRVTLNDLDMIPIVDISLNMTSQVSILELQSKVLEGVTGGESNWGSISNTPTTLGGYGITDSYTISQIDQLLSAYSPNLSYSSSISDGLLSSVNWNTFNNKQPALVSGTNIKTINGTSILGSGNIAITSGTSTVKISFTATEGQTTFVCTGVVLNLPMVFLNGVLQDNLITYMYLNDTITFLEARVLNETILVVN